MEGDGLGLDFSFFHIDFVAGKNNRDIFANTDKIAYDCVRFVTSVNDIWELTVPVGDVLVGDTRCDVEHDDPTLAVDVVSISETAELFLTCGVPDIELDLTVILHNSERDPPASERLESLLS